MDININVNRKYSINGREYGSLEEMPAEIREAFEKAMEFQTAAGSGTGQADLRTRIIFNDQEYESVASMPESVRTLYETVMKAAESGKIPPQMIQNALGERGVRSSPPEPGRNTIRVEASFSVGTLAVGLILFAALLFLWYLFQGSGSR